MSEENNAMDKKRQNIVENIKRHLFYLNRWEFINKKKAELTKEKLELLNKIHFASTWYKIRMMHVDI